MFSRTNLLKPTLFVKPVFSPSLHHMPLNILCLQCLGQDVDVLVDTGCKLNLMSSLMVERFGWDIHYLSLLLTPGNFLCSESYSVSLSKSERSGGGKQNGDGRVSTPEEALHWRMYQGAEPDHRRAQSHVLLCHHRWERRAWSSKLLAVVTWITDFISFICRK